MTAINTNVGSPGTIGPASGGSVFAFNNISTAPTQVIGSDPQRQSISFYNPGTISIYVAPTTVQTNGSDVPLTPSPSALGGCFIVPSGGGSITITGECQKPWQAFSASGSSNSLTITGNIISSSAPVQQSIIVGGSVFDTYAEASAYTPTTAPESIYILGYNTVGDYGAGLYKKVNSEPTHGGKLFIVTLAGVTVWYELAEPVITPQMLGAEGSPTNDTTALANAIGMGRPIFIPIGTIVSDQITITSQDNIEIYGYEGSILQSSTPDTRLFHFVTCDHIRVHDLTFRGADAATGVAQSDAMKFLNCNDVTCYALNLLNWKDCGIRIWGTASTNTISRDAMFDRIIMKDTQSPQRFTSAAIFISEHTENFTVQNGTFEDGNGGVFIINSQITYNYHMKNHKVLNNRITRMQQYGIICYGAGAQHTVTNAVDNGAGLIRLTAATHECVTGDTISMTTPIVGTVEANNVWVVTVIDANTVDLDGSTFVNAYVSGGVFAVYNPGNHEVAGNYISYVDGTPTVTNGMNGNFGAGIYGVGMNGLDIHDNVCTFCNTGTTSASLSPAGIGLGGNIGAIKVHSNTIQNCLWYGIYTPSAPYTFHQIYDNTINTTDKTAIFLYNVGSWSINNNRIEAKRFSTLSFGIIIQSTTGPENCICNNNSIISYNTVAIVQIVDTSSFVFSGNLITNLGPSTLACRVAYFSGCDAGAVSGNVFNGGLTEFLALHIHNTTNTIISGNYSIITDGGTAPTTVLMDGTCTGTVYTNDNVNLIGRMENSSTGGTMHTRSTNNLSGNHIRSQGDTILRTDITAGSVAMWGKKAQSNAGADWTTLTWA